MKNRHQKNNPALFVGKAIMAFTFAAFATTVVYAQTGTSTSGATITMGASGAGAGTVMNPLANPANGETFYLKENARNRKAVPYVPEQEADIMWQKRVWRTIDLREKMNLPLYYPEAPLNDRASLFDVMKKGLLDGSLHAYDNPAMDDEFTTPMSPKQIQDLFVQWDSTNQCEDPNNPGTWIICPIKTELTSPMVKQYWVKEDWYFDKERGVMDVRIIGLCPLKEKLNPSTGEVEGYEPLFWVYFPELRQTLANAEAYNTKNDAQRMTYDDLFMKRMFSSYVRKESNVYDRPIYAYAQGIDAQLESERIKNDIFSYEHDMWHF
ncbi:MAG TPA: gliding motility protein GldN [Bacteroidia bacterium]|nr:gliding motility protein GldN [Bacteroidia bacterium]